MSDGPVAPPPPPPNMMIFLFMMIGMMLLMTREGFRMGLAETAEPVIRGVIPSSTPFIFTVLVLGSFSMVVNTVLRNLFVDPIDQAHLQHRSREINSIRRKAMMNKDTALQDKATTLSQHLMPQSMEVQMGTMKPMMFTFIFIVAIFAWMESMVGTHRVEYVSLPWAATWEFSDRFLLFPAWICAYICMSAPLGRMIDRHMKLLRYRNHDRVTSGELMPEPLLHLVAPKKQNRAGRRSKRGGKSRPTDRRSATNRITNALTMGVRCDGCGNTETITAPGKGVICAVCMVQRT